MTAWWTVWVSVSVTDEKDRDQISTYIIYLSILKWWPRRKAKLFYWSVNDRPEIYILYMYQRRWHRQRLLLSTSFYFYSCCLLPHPQWNWTNKFHIFSAWNNFREFHALARFCHMYLVRDQCLQIFQKQYQNSQNEKYFLFTGGS